MLRNILLQFIVLILLCNSAFALGKKKDKEINEAQHSENMADSLSLKEEYKNAIFEYKNAANLFEKNKLWIDVVRNTRKIAWCHLSLNELDSASKYNQIAYTFLNEKLNINNNFSNLEESEIYYTKAKIFSKKHNHDSTIYYTSKSLQIINTLNTKDKEHLLLKAKYCQTIGYTHLLKGNYDEALKYNLEARKIGLYFLSEDHKLVLDSQFNIAIIYYSKRDFEKANENFNQIIQTAGEHSFRAARCYNYLGAIQHIKKEYKGAVKYYEKVIQICEKLNSKNSAFAAAVINNTGQAYYMLKEYDIALTKIEESIKITKENLGQNHPSLSKKLLGLAEYYYELEQFDRATITLENAINILDENKSNDNVLYSRLYNYIGVVQIELSNFEIALDFFQKAICKLITEFDYDSKLSNPELFLENKLNPKYGSFAEYEIFEFLTNKAFSLYKIYEQSHNENQLLKSLNTYSLAFKLYDHIRINMNSNESKYLMSSSEKRFLQDAVNVCLKLDSLFPKKNYTDSALKYIDKCKSSSLKDKTHFNIAIDKSVIPSDLAIQQQELSEKLAYYQTRIGKDNSTNLDKLKEEYNQLSLEYDTLDIFIKKNYPSFFDNSQFNTFNLKKIQSEIKEHEIVLDYFVTENNILIASITSKNVNFINIAIDSSFKNNVLNYHKSIRKIEISNYIHTNKELYSKLIEPIQNRIKDKSSLIIIPDDYLFYIPFESLFDYNDSHNNIQNFNYLIKDYDIRYNYSLTFWAFNKQQQKNKINYIADFIGFAPVFKDSETNLQNETNDNTERSARINGKTFSSLHYSETEIKNIEELFHANQKKTKIFLNQDATEENFKKLTNAYQFIHISTHGFSNKDNINLSGLAFYNTDNLGEDGLLFASEIRNLNISSDLMVLSACETGIGKLVQGEGLIGLAREFVGPNIHNIIYSLWNIADKSSSIFMINFYTNILTGQSYSEALRKTKLDMLNNIKTCHPKLWSSFIIIGN